MKDQSFGWLWKVTGRKKGYSVLLMAVQSLYGFSGVLYALLLKRVVDAAAGGNAETFVTSMISLILLALAQVTLRAVIRRTSESARAGFENCLKGRLVEQLVKLALRLHPFMLMKNISIAYVRFWVGKVNTRKF